MRERGQLDQCRICVRLSPSAQLCGHLKHAPSDFVVNELRGEDGSEVVLGEDSPAAQFCGHLKHAPSDFVVNELRGEDGSEVVLGEDGSAQPRKRARADGEYVAFTLHKIRRGTLDALVELGQHLGIPLRSFSVCGIKDAFAVTTQEVVARGASVEALRAIALTDRLIGDARAADGPLRIGGAAGNRFAIRVRGMRCSRAELEAAAAALRSRGFVNYYGLQRFGTAHVRSYELGRSLLRREYAVLLEAIVCSPAAAASSMPADEREARDHFRLTRDAGTALRRFPRRLRVERELLARLHRADLRKEGGGWEAQCRAAILSLPLAKRKLWANAYSSYIYNMAATERVCRYGTVPVAGDLVLPACARPTVLRDAGARRADEQPRVLTVEDVLAGRYALADVVLPLVGSRVRFPEHGVGELCRAYVAYDGIEAHTLEVRNSRREGEEEDGWLDADGCARSGGGEGEPCAGAPHAPPAVDGLGEGDDEGGDCPGGLTWNGEYEMRGCYRHLIAHTQGLTAIALAADQETPLPSGRMHFARDDSLNLPRGSLPAAPDRPPAAVGGEASGAGAGAECEDVVTDALLSFSLPAGCYATVALREIIATDAEAETGAAPSAAGTEGAASMGSRHIRFESDDDSDDSLDDR